MFEIVKYNKKFLFDIGLNIVASFIMTGMLQLLIYPYLANRLGANIYGEILTLIGISNIFSVTFGGALNNIRLLKDYVYKKNGLKGDFSILCVGSLLIIVIFLPIILKLISSLSTKLVLLILLITILGFIRSYYSVGFRIVINYKKYLLQSIIYCIGGLLGLLITIYSVEIVWQWPFILAELLACIYIFFTNKKLFNEPLKRTHYFFDTSKDYIYLLLCTVIGNILTYLDRLLLYPALGGANVSIYYTATFFGKTLGIVMMPIAGVILSYYAQKERMSLKQFWMQNMAILVSCGLFYFLSLILAKPITGWLYPSLIKDSIQYIPLANLSAVLLVAATIIQPAVLKYCKISYQPIIQIVHLVLYLGMALLFLDSYGMMGFCIAAVIANLIKVILLIILGQITLKNQKT